METFMDVEYLDIHKDLFDEIVEDIKQRNLSKSIIEGRLIVEYCCHI